MNGKTANLTSGQYQTATLTINDKSEQVFFTYANISGKLVPSRIFRFKRIQLKNATPQEEMRLITRAYTQWYNASIDYHTTSITFSGTDWDDDVSRVMDITGYKDVSENEFMRNAVIEHLKEKFPNPPSWPLIILKGK